MGTTSTCCLIESGEPQEGSIQAHAMRNDTVVINKALRRLVPASHTNTMPVEFVAAVAANME
jgi:hypothetical protein